MDEVLINGLDAGNPLFLHANDNSNVPIINGLKQGGLSMPNYYHKLNSLWKEFDTLTLLPSCTCAAHKGSNILSKDPLPDVKDAFSVVSRGLHPGSLSGSKVQPAAFVFKPNSFKSNDFKRNSNNTNRGPNPNLLCNNNGLIGHTVERCYELIGHFCSF
ncbi:hypothetical protein Tco_1504344 [Tanacetum coccineum]